MKQIWVSRSPNNVLCSTSGCGVASNKGEVYLRAYDNISAARASIGRYLNVYSGRNHTRSVDGMTPDQAYVTPLPIRLAA